MEETLPIDHGRDGAVLSPDEKEKPRCNFSITLSCLPLKKHLNPLPGTDPHLDSPQWHLGQLGEALSVFTKVAFGAAGGGWETNKKLKRNTNFFLATEALQHVPVVCWDLLTDGQDISSSSPAPDLAAPLCMAGHRPCQVPALNSEVPLLTHCCSNDLSHETGAAAPHLRGHAFSFSSFSAHSLLLGHSAGMRQRLG